MFSPLFQYPLDEVWPRGVLTVGEGIVPFFEDEALSELHYLFLQRNIRVCQADQKADGYCPFSRGPVGRELVREQAEGRTPTAGRLKLVCTLK